VLIYIGHLGGTLVYSYGVGTALMSPPTAIESPAAPPMANASLPTVSVPTATPTISTSAAIVTATATPSATATATPHP
jgi:hypothetical protein